MFKLLLALLLIGCGSREVPIIKMPKMTKVSEYEKVINTLDYVRKPNNTNKVSITSSTKLEEFILGRCYIYSKITTSATGELISQELIRTILINANYFPSLSYEAQYELIAHEYLHCRYNIEHDTQEVGLLMSPSMYVDEPLTVEETNAQYISYIKD